MAGSRIKGITIELDGDTRGLDQALRNVNQRSRDLYSELKDVERLLKFNPGNTELLAQQQRLLGEQVENTAEKLQQLRDVQEQVRQQFERGEIDEGQYRAFQRELIATEGRLEHFQNQLRDTQTEADDTGERMEALGNKFKGIGEGMKNAGGTMSAAFTAPILGGLALVTEGTEELRADLAKLETNALNTGFGVDFMGEQLERINGIIPDTNANIEGLSNLMATPLSEAGLVEVVDALAGAVIRFPETLNFEGLADGLQETFAVGEAAGTFAELLERSGIELEGFNEGLAKAIKNGEEENYILETLANTGLASVNEEFRNNNKELIENREATLRFQTAMAELGTTLLPIITSAKNAIAELTEWFNSLDESQQKTILTIAGIVAAAGPLLVVIGSVISIIGGLIGIAATLGVSIGALMLPITLIVAGIAALIAIGVALYQNWETISTKGQEIFTNVLNFMINIWNLITTTIGMALDWIDQQTNGKFTSITNTVRNFMTLASDVIERSWQFIKDTFSNALKFAKALLTGDFETMWQVVQDQMGNIKDTVKDIWGEVESFFEGIDLSAIGADIIRGLISGMASMAGAIMRKVGELASLIPDGMKEFLGIASPSRLMRDEIGKWIPLGVAEGISRNAGAIDRASADMMAAAIPTLPKMPAGGIGAAGSSTGGTTGGNHTFNFSGMMQGATFVVRNDYDIEKIAQQLGDYVTMQARKGGVIFGR